MWILFSRILGWFWNIRFMVHNEYWMNIYCESDYNTDVHIQYIQFRSLKKTYFLSFLVHNNLRIEAVPAFSLHFPCSIHTCIDIILNPLCQTQIRGYNPNSPYSVISLVFSISPKHWLYIENHFQIWQYRRRADICQNWTSFEEIMMQY